MAENQIRLSQLIGYHGPGAMLDLPDRSVLVMGLDHWDQRSGAFRLIEEPRLSRLLRLRLQDDLAKRLAAKNKVVVSFKRPDPIVENISVGTSPAQGPATAPVTVVMFSDFQCPACSATEPILRKVIEQYPGKIRFVVRDYPLTELHENAEQSFDARLLLAPPQSLNVTALLFSLR